VGHPPLGVIVLGKQAIWTKASGIASEDIGVLMESDRINHEIVPPVIISDGDDVQAFPSVQSAILEVEAIDVLKNVIKFHDSTGRIL
jgi:hypothetical protein